MAGFRVYIDERIIKGDVRRLNRGWQAMRRTVDNMGFGVVVTSARKKIKGEKSKQLHGRAIANILRDRFGKDPFDYDHGFLKRTGDGLAIEVETAMGDAYRMQSHQTDRIKKALTVAAENMAAEAQQGVESGKLGEKKIPGGTARKSYIARMHRLANRGFVTRRYGLPPPFGIRSGRFVAGIRGVWKLGRRAR
jgi:hypothetical protein